MLFVLSRKIRRVGFPKLEDVGIILLLFFSLEHVLFLPLIRERRALSLVLGNEQPVRVRVPATSLSQGCMESLESTSSGSEASKKGEKGDQNGSEELERVLKGLLLPLTLLWMSNTSQNPFEEQH